MHYFAGEEITEKGGAEEDCASSKSKSENTFHALMSASKTP